MAVHVSIHDVSPAWAREVDLALEMAHAHGLRPALLVGPGYGFTEDHMRVYDPAAKRSRASVVLNYASRTPSRLLSSVAWCRIARPARAVLPARIAIHPADMRYALLRSEVESLLAW